MIFRLFPGETGQCHSVTCFQLDVVTSCTDFQARERSTVHSDDFILP